jgi:predicted RNA methylase
MSVLILRRLRAVPALAGIVRRARRWRLRQIQRAADRGYGIQTLHVAGDMYDRAPVQYEPTKYAAIDACLGHLALSPADVVFDIGCGMGRVTCVFATRPIARSIGIERDERLAAVARANAESLRGRRAPIEIRTVDAMDADYADGTVFWLYNPFGEDAMRRTLIRIRASVEAAPRPIRIVYAAPNFEAPFEASDWLERTATISVQYDLTSDMPASFWVNRRFRGGTA